MNNIQTISKAVRQTSHHRLGILVATVVVFLLLAYWLLVMPSPVIIFMLVIAAAIGFLIVLRPYVGFLLMVASLGFEAITPGLPVTIFRILGLWTFYAWLLRKLLAGELPLVMAPQNVCIATFILTALASAFSALQFDISLVQIATLIQLSVLYFFVTGIVDSEQRLKHVAWTWVVGGTAASLYSIAALISQDMERAVGGIGDPNYLVLYLTIPIALSLFLFQAERSSILRTFLGFSLLTFLVVTILSFSRGGFISLIVILVLSFLKSQDKRRVITSLIAVAVTILILSAFLPMIPIQSWLQRVSIQTALQDAGAGRFYIWRGGLDMFMDHPLAGVGIGNFMHRYPEYSYYDPRGPQQRVAHNTFLEIAAEQGIFGLLAFLSLLLLTYQYLRKAQMTAEERKLLFTAQITQALQIGFIGFLIGNLFLTAYLSKSLWLVFGLAVATYSTILHKSRVIMK